MENRKICLGHGKVMEFQIFPKTVFSYWLKSQKKKKKKEKRKLCVKHQNVQPVGHLTHCFHQSSSQF